MVKGDSPLAREPRLEPHRNQCPLDSFRAERAFAGHAFAEPGWPPGPSSLPAPPSNLPRSNKVPPTFRTEHVLRLRLLFAMHQQGSSSDKLVVFLRLL